MEDQEKRLIADAETKAAEGDNRTLLVKISTSSPDRDGDIVVPEGGELKHFKKNPVVLFGHNYSQPPIAKAEKLSIGDKDITARVVFPEKGLYPFADTVYDLYKAGIMSAWSIGFIPKESTHLDPERPWGPQRFEKWEMLEFSAVPVPANPEALTIARSHGLDDKTIKKLTFEAKTEEAEEEQEETPSVEDLQAKIQQLETENAELKAKLTPATDEPAEESADVSKALTALRDALKPADKEIGLALRTLKQLIKEPTS
jgi:HK97 family phage prohead protease